MIDMESIERRLKADIDEYQDCLVDRLKATAPVDTGELYNSIKKISNDSVEFLYYGVYTSDGTSKIKPTHWIDRGIETSLTDYERISNK